MSRVSVLGIDAAWTARQPSGVALVAKDSAGPWYCLCVAPSYSAFLQAADGNQVEWNEKRHGGDTPDVKRIMSASSYVLGGENVDIATIDMPVSLTPITCRRAADNAISKEFGAAGCGTHSPNTTRPGALGFDVTAAFGDAGYPVATVDDTVGTLSRLVEVYPHPALLALQNETYRLQYKAGKSRTYWPSAGVPERIENLLLVYKRILSSLNSEIVDINLPLPTANSCPNISSLKRYEDSLDALVCAWVGCQYVDGNAIPYGDATAAIWIPAARTLPS